MTRLRFALPVALVLFAVACSGGSDSATDEPDTATTVASVEPSTTLTGATGTDTVQEGDTVSVHYVGTLDDGELFDSSRDRGQPLTFSVGSGQMIPGFDAAVRDMAIGEVKTVRLAPAEAYGESNADRIIEVAIDQVPADVIVGATLVTGQQSVTVIAIDGDVVTLDANHPLAGEFLTFEIEIVSIN